MLLSDVNIRYEIRSHGLVIEPLDPARIGPASVDLCLSPHFVRFGDIGHSAPTRVPIDPKQDHSTDGYPQTSQDGEPITLGPGEFALASTVERWTFPAHLAGRLEGKSSLGRLGLLVHTTAGFFDPGFEGYPTLELVNVRNRPFLLHPGMPIAQMSVFSMVSPAATSYATKHDAKYADQGPLPQQSKYHLNFSEGA